MKYSQIKGKNRETNPILDNKAPFSNIDDKNTTANAVGKDYSWIGGIGDSATNILDVILNGNNATKNNTAQVELVEKKSNIVWWIAGAIGIIALIIGFSIYLKKRK